MAASIEEHERILRESREQVSRRHQAALAERRERREREKARQQQQAPVEEPEPLADGWQRLGNYRIRAVKELPPAGESAKS